MTAVPNYAGTWESLVPKLSPSTLEAISHLGFDKLTPVQAAAIPLFMQNKDVVVEAVTGSGKTLAFLVPVIEKLKRLEVPLDGRKVGAIIISPTRELARQTYQVCTSLLEQEILVNPEIGSQLQPMLLTGGGGASALDRDVRSIKATPPRILIGTPGRLEEVLVNRQGLIDSKDLEILVLDEADRLLELGFSTVLNKIIAAVPKQRRTGLFSATMTDDLSELVRAGLRNPVKVVVKVSKAAQRDSSRSGSVSDLILKEQRIPDSLTVEYIVCRPWQKLAQISRYLKASNFKGKYVIYFSTCAVVDYFFKIFKLISGIEDYEIVSLHGQMDLKHRTATLKKFTELGIAGRGTILITTDVASRGLDIPDVDGVIQFDLPVDPKAFAHRCGRTARAGRQGRALFFLSPGREELYPDFLHVRKVPTLRKAYLLPENSDSNVGPSTSDSLGPIKEVIESEDPIAFKKLRELRAKIAEDRVLSEKGVKAFVSFVNAYSKHQASYIFRIPELDFASHAWAYLLLRLPKMPELKNKNIVFEDYSVKITDIPYANKLREANRQTKLQEASSKPIESKKKPYVPKTQAWSKKIAAKNRKEKRKHSKLVKATALHAMGQNSGSNDMSNSLVSMINSKSRNKSIGEVDNDLDDLQHEARLVKKMRKGKMSQAEVDNELYNSL